MKKIGIRSSNLHCVHFSPNYINLVTNHLAKRQQCFPSKFSGTEYTVLVLCVTVCKYAQVIQVGYTKYMILTTGISGIQSLKLPGTWYLN